jgi:succinyl-CoA synthetase beta subunit
LIRPSSGRQRLAAQAGFRLAQHLRNIDALDGSIGEAEIDLARDAALDGFINIFGGITKGEEVANGIVTALGRVDIDVPIVIRLDGTNADLGREILQPHLSDKLQMEPTMLDAAKRVVELAGK